jgi:hypothetical protein
MIWVISGRTPTRVSRAPSKVDAGYYATLRWPVKFKINWRTFFRIIWRYMDTL